MPRLSDRRANMKEQLMGQVKDSFERKDSGGGMYGSVWRKDVKFTEWTCKPNKEGEDPHVIDILPVLVGKKHSTLIPNINPGDIVYRAEYFVHSNIGPNSEKVICPRSFGNACPICEDRKEIAENSPMSYKDVKASALKASKQCIYRVVCYDTNDEQKKGAQIWMVAHFFFEKYIAGLARIPGRAGYAGGFINFSDVDDGKYISFYRYNRKGPDGNTNTTYEAHKFNDRNYVIEESVWDAPLGKDADGNELFTIEDLVKVYEYDELKALYLGKKRAATEEEEETPVQTSGPRIEHSPASAPAAPSVVPKTEVQASIRSSGVCPSPGGVFGQDIDSLDYCSKCTVYKECAVKSEEMEGKTKTKTASAPAPIPTPVSKPVPEPVVTQSNPTEPVSTDGPVRRRRG